MHDLQSKHFAYVSSPGSGLNKVRINELIDEDAIVSYKISN